MKIQTSTTQKGFNSRSRHTAGVKPNAKDLTKLMKHEGEDRLLDKVLGQVEAVTALVYLVGYEKRLHGAVSSKTRTKLLREIEKAAKLLTGIPNKLITP